MELEEVLKKYKKPKKPMPLNHIIRVFIREGIENFYICRKEDIDVLIEGVDNLQKENEELKKRFKRYGDVDLVKIAQIKEIEETVPQIYMDKKTYENLLKEE